ncbi:kinase-like protein, partial [Vararia minispora EC-137]
PSATGLFSGGYYGGPALAPQPRALDGAGDTTIRPDNDTIPDSRRPKPPSIDDVTRTLKDIEIRSHPHSDLASSASSSSSSSASPFQPEPYPYSEFNDDLLTVQSRLGEGAGGAVHSVRDTRTSALLARKTIQTREAPMKQLLRELNLITTIAHPNIIRFFGAYMSPSSSEVKVVMELCDGKSLEAVGKRIRERGARVGEKVAGRLAEGVLQGLAYLRSKDLIHRDIKPSNILLSRDGVVKLCDFGVSGELVGSVVDTFTGTSLYMAPERLSGLEYSIRADVWSTGLSLLELVQNRFPFSADLAPIELMIHITQSEAHEDDLHWSDAMKDFIKETLRVDPVLRPTPKDLLAHEWIVRIMAMDVNMARWIREVWGWPKPARKLRE